MPRRAARSRPRRRTRGPLRRALQRIPWLVRGAFGVVTAVVALLLALQQLGFSPLGGGSKDRFDNAAEKIRDAGSSRLDFARTIHAQSGVRSQQGQGKFDYRAGAGELRFTNGSRLVLLKPYVYEFGVSRKRVWCEYDLSALGPGFLFGAITGFRDDPGAALVSLKEAGSYEKVGEEMLFNIRTTHYSGHVDLERLLDQTKEPAIRALLRQFSSFNGGKLPVDVWLSSDDVVQRLGASFDVPGRAYGVRGRVHVEGTYDFSDFGTPVTVKQPPRAKIAKAGARGCPSTV
jgi:hypothetical protein